MGRFYRGIDVRGVVEDEVIDLDEVFDDDLESFNWRTEGEHVWAVLVNDEDEEEDPVYGILQVGCRFGITAWRPTTWDDEHILDWGEVTLDREAALAELNGQLREEYGEASLADAAVSAAAKAEADNRQVRLAVRSWLLTATQDQLQKELSISEEKGDSLRAEYVQEIIDECQAAGVESLGDLPF